MSSAIQLLLFLSVTALLTSCQFKADRDPADETSRRLRRETPQQVPPGEGQRTQEDRDQERRREEAREEERRRANRDDGYPTRSRTGGSTDSGSESNSGSGQSGGSYGGGGDSGNTPTN